MGVIWLFALLSTVAVRADAIGIALTPPMGWNPYNHYGCGVNEERMRKQTTALLELGLDKAGFVYMNLDCGWAEQIRAADGSVVPKKDRFPNGMKSLATWIHSKGLKFGMYTDIGNITCGGGSGILGHEEQDAHTYSEWGVDLVKNDDCHHAANTTAAYGATWAALQRTGRPMIHMVKASLDVSNPLSRSFAQARRVSKDITWLWGRIKSLVYQQQAWNGNLSNISGIQPSTGNGFWNDMDMMEIGNAGVGDYQGRWQNLTFAESRTHFALWSLLKSPMILGCDLTVQRPDIVDVLRNEEATAFNQDALGVQATMLTSSIVHSAESYMVLKPCNATDIRQVGWSFVGNTVRTSANMCITAAHPMYDAVLLPCNVSDPRQHWILNEKEGTLMTEIRYTDSQPTCLVAAFAHALRGSSVSVGICRANSPHWILHGDSTLGIATGNSSELNPLAKPKKNCIVRLDESPMENALHVGELQVYGGPLANGDFGVGLVNVDTLTSHNITVHWSHLGLLQNQSMRVRDVWQKQDKGTYIDHFTMTVAPHDTALFRLSIDDGQAAGIAMLV